MSGLLCLKWNNHSSAFLKKLIWLRGKGQYCDATIVCQNKYFAVHKLVLSTCSEYFEEIFEKTQCKHPFIIVKDIQPSELEALLNYMYKGEVNILQELLPNLLKAAESLQIKGLAVPDEEIYSEECSDESRSTEKRSIEFHHLPLSKKSKNLNYCDKRKSAESTKILLKEYNSENSENLNETFDKPDLGKVPDSVNCSQSNIDKELEFLDQSQIKDELAEIAQCSEEISTKNEFLSILDEERMIKEEKFISEDEISNSAKDLSQPQCSSWDEPMADPFHSNQDEVSQEISGTNISTICEMNMQESNEKIGPNVSEDSTLENNQERTVIAQKKPGVKCPLCSHIATKPCKLKLHMYKHSGEKPFSCPHCTYTARTRYHVTVHLRKHTGEKPFECDYCSYKASNKANISRHMRIHSNEKPYQCPQCPYAATQASHLQDHMRQHYD